LEVRNRFSAVMQILSFLAVFWVPSAQRLARKTLVATVLFGVVLNIYELFFPMSFSHVLGRSAGLYMNPTLTGEALVLGMILGVTALEPRYRASFILIAAIGVFVTFSRAGILACVIAVAGLTLTGSVSLKNLFTSALLAVLLTVVVLLPRWDKLLTTWERTGVLNGNVEERLAWLTDPSGVTDNSSWERKYLARQAWDKIADRPFLGSGTGTSVQASIQPHNQYLAFMLDHGLIGALVLPLLVLAATWGAEGTNRGVAVIFGCTVMVFSLFTHTILNTSYSLILFALMAAMAARNDHDETEEKVSTAVRDQVPVPARATSPLGQSG
jgi:O-antigen ligase